MPGVVLSSLHAQLLRIRPARSVAPLLFPDDAAAITGARYVDSMFTEAFTKGRQLVRGDPRRCVHMACAVMARGDIVLSDVTRNVDRIKREISMVHWNADGAA